MTRKLPKNESKAIVSHDKIVRASAQESVVAPCKEKSETDESIKKKKKKKKDKKKKAAGISLPRGLSLISGDLRNIDKGDVLLKREVASIAPNTERSTRGYYLSDLPVLYIGFMKMRIDLFEHRKDVVKAGKQFSDAYRTVVLFRGDPKKSNISRKAFNQSGSGIFLHNYDEILRGFSKYTFSNFPEELEEATKAAMGTKGQQIRGPILGTVNTALGSYQNLQTIGLQIGRMPRELCKTAFEFIITRGLMPPEYLDFLMQFATGNEISYLPSAVNRIQYCVSKHQYPKAVQEAREFTFNILEKIKATECPIRDKSLWYSDSALVWDLVLELEKVSPFDTLEALKIIFLEMPEKQVSSLFDVMAMDKFCDISLRLFIEGGRQNFKLIEEALDASLRRLETVTCLPALLTFVKLIEEASDLTVDKNEITKLAPEPEYMLGYGEALAIVLSTLTDHIYQARKKLISDKTEGHELDAAPLALQTQSLPGLGLTGYSVGGSRSASLTDAISGSHQSEAGAAAPIALPSGDSSGVETVPEKDSDLNKSRKFE